MKISLLFTAFVLLFSISFTAQNLIAVQNGSNVSFYTQVKNAVSAAEKWQGFLIVFVSDDFLFVTYGS